MTDTERRIPVGIVVERRDAVSPWIDSLWRSVGVLAGVPDAAAWTRLSAEPRGETYYADAVEIVLYRSEAQNYRANLASGAPAVWVTLRETGGVPPYAVAGATADPAEGEAWTEPGDAIVEAVPMPEPVREAVADFVAQFPAQPGFVKRQRDRADPEALARRGSPPAKRDEGR